MEKILKIGKNTPENSEKYSGELGKILGDLKKGPHFILVKHFGKILQQNSEKYSGKLRKILRENSEKYFPKTRNPEAKSLFPTMLPT